jgi:hypothetical protein
LAVVAKPAAAATAPPELSLNVLLIGTGRQRCRARA